MARALRRRDHDVAGERFDDPPRGSATVPMQDRIPTDGRSLASERWPDRVRRANIRMDFHPAFGYALRLISDAFFRAFIELAS
jgi:hypothetical protein